MESRDPFTMFRNYKKNVFVLFFILILTIFLVFHAIYTPVKYGTVAVVTRFGRVTDRVLEPGLNWKLPFVESVLVYNTQKITYETSEYPLDSNANYTDYPVDTTTKDGQSVDVRYTVRFSINPDMVKWVANNLGTEEDIVEKIIKTESRIYVRNIIRKYEAEKLYTGDIQDAQKEITDVLKQKLESNGLVLDEFGIRQIQFQQEYIDAIEAKQIEKEKVITEKYKAEQEEYKKQQAITKAQGEAEAQKLQQQTLNDVLIKKMWIEKWNGTLPLYMGSGNESFLLNLKNED